MYKHASECSSEVVVIIDYSPYVSRLCLCICNWRCCSWFVVTGHSDRLMVDYRLLLVVKGQYQVKRLGFFILRQ
jgi:hypothetical protein